MFAYLVTTFGRVGNVKERNEEYQNIKCWAQQQGCNYSLNENTDSWSAEQNVKRHPNYKQHETSEERLSARAGLLFEVWGAKLGSYTSRVQLDVIGGSGHISQAGPARVMWAPRAG